MKRLLAISLFALLLVGIGSSFILYVDTTVGSSVAAGEQSVKPRNMYNIVVGGQYYFDGFAGLPTGEIITVTAITSQRFTAVFAHPHDSGARMTNNPAYFGDCVMWGT